MTTPTVSATTLHVEKRPQTRPVVALRGQLLIIEAMTSSQGLFTYARCATDDRQLSSSAVGYYAVSQRAGPAASLW